MRRFVEQRVVIVVVGVDDEGNVGVVVVEQRNEN
jgi:hypothetical protein